MFCDTKLTKFFRFSRIVGDLIKKKNSIHLDTVTANLKQSCFCQKCFNTKKTFSTWTVSIHFMQWLFRYQDLPNSIFGMGKLLKNVV